MRDHIQTFERLITKLLVWLMAMVVLLSVIDLAWLLIKDIITPPILLLDVDELLDLFGLFLLVLIGIELLETLRSHTREREIRTEIIILVALIALARKVVTLDIKAVPSLSLLGMAAIIVALGITYHLIKKRTHFDSSQSDPKQMAHRREG